MSELSLPPSLRTYAGIGSRETPPDVLAYMHDLARSWAEFGVKLRSGGARGADTAFEEGCDEVDGPKEIFHADDANLDAMKHAAKFHPNWDACGSYARKLHARNSMIILGRSLNEPVDMVVCWTPKAVKIGGTAQALRIAEHEGIQIVNLGEEWYGFSH
jgi:hypothetical protein